MLSLINGSLLKQSPVSKHTLKQVFELFCDTRADWSAKTLAKQRKIFHSKLSHLADKDISLIKREDILIILDQIFNQGKYSALKDTYSLIQRVFAFAKARNICDNPFGGLGLSSFYHTPKSLGHSWINSVEDLRHLIKFIMRYPHSPSVKYALMLGLITGLRSSNVRYLNISQLNINELRLFFPAKGNKIHRDEYLGIPNELASWLLKIKPINSDLFFPSIKSEALSEATLSKALRNFIPIDAKEGLVFHSFRKILSTFCYENRHISKLTPYDIEKALFHKSFGIVEVYNKAMNIQATREVISWWLGYLKDNGLSLE